MVKGISLHVGLNEYDKSHYGNKGKLYGCENDALAMQSIAKSQGFQTSVLLTFEATSSNLLNQISDAAENLKTGDIFLLTYAGHGSQIPDLNGEEDDKRDETWCLYDRMFIDDELNKALRLFDSGVRIVLISDSCHSGTMFRNRSFNSDNLSRSIPFAISTEIYINNLDIYEPIQKSKTRATSIKLLASVIMLSACQDNETASDGDENGLFTSYLLDVWNNGEFNGGYYDFYQKIYENLSPTQRPNYGKLGVINIKFENEHPFFVASNVKSFKTNFSKQKGEKKKMLTNNMDEQLANLKKSKQASRGVIGNSSESCCSLKLDIPIGVIENMSDDQIYSFLSNEGSDVLMESYLLTKQISMPRGGSGSVSCTTNPKGETSCTGTARWDF